MKWILMVLALLANPVFAQELPPPTARGTDKNLTVTAILTTTPNWREMMANAAQVAPRFATHEALSTGEKATLLIFFAGAEAIDGRVSIDCDLYVTDTNEPEPFRVAPTACRTEPIGPIEEQMYRADLTLGLEVDEDDNDGEINITIGVTDRNTNARVEVTVATKILRKE